jgi:hypothetical protein
MVTVAAFESDGFALGVLTVTLPVPVAARSVAGTVAVREVPLNEPEIPNNVRGAPFQYTADVFENPVPSTVIWVSGEP